MSSLAAVCNEQRLLLGWSRAQPAVVGRPGGGPVARGSTLEWTGPGESHEWSLTGPVAALETRGTRTLAKLDGAPVLAWDGAGRLVCGLDPGDALAQPAICAALRRAITAAGPACAWLDLSSVVALRMDDPGASASVHLDPWSYERLAGEGWEAIGDLLERYGARMTAAYAPGWVDDGDPERGELRVDGQLVERVAARVHPSAQVRYQGHFTADCESEYRALVELRARDLVSFELHGHTHVHPDLERWAASASRHEKLGWYRELGSEVDRAIERRAAEEHPVALGSELFREHFGEQPAVLVCPGNAWSPDTLARAHQLGLEAVAAQRFAIRDGEGFSWLSGLVTQALDSDPEHALATDAPAIACFHDRDVALGGVAWLERWLKRWRSAGVRRFADLRELTSALGLAISLERGASRWRLRAERRQGAPSPRGVPVLIRTPGPPGAQIECRTEAGELRLEVEPVGECLGRVQLPRGT